MSNTKYGAHVFIWQDRYRDSELLRIMECAEGLGLEFLEIAVGDDVRFDPGRIGRAAADHRLELVLSPGGEWPDECDISLEPQEQRQAGVRWHQRAIETAAACGAGVYAGALYGHPGRVVRRAPCPDEKRRVAGGLHHLAEFAAARNVHLVLEPMSHFRTHIANTPAQINALIELADHANLSCLLDTYHLCTEVPDLSAAFAQLRPRLWGVHACENHRGAPGTGWLPWQNLIDGMVGSGWSGRIGFESYNSTWRGGDFARERGMFHNVCPDAKQFIRQAMTHLDTCFQRAQSGV